jgi:hypothetical protein
MVPRTYGFASSLDRAIGLVGLLALCIAFSMLSHLAG